MKRALVLGGGGNVGIAWEIAVLAGLLDGGVDAREADLVIGTSAGSVVGADLAHGRDPRDLLRKLREAPAKPLGGLASPDMARVTEVFQAWGAFEEMTPRACAAVGAIVLQATPVIPEERWVASFDANEWPGWPARPYIATAVDCVSGAFRTLDAHSGISLERACAASCSVPGMFPPVMIDGSPHMDGGVRSGTSADVAQRIEPDRVLVVAPLGRGGRGIHLLCARQIAREKGELEAVGATVRVVQMDDAAMASGGANLMDASLRVPTAAAGEAHGRALATEFKAWWGSAASR